MGMRYIRDELEKAIIRSGYDDVGKFINEAVREKLNKNKEKGEKSTGP